MQDQSLAVHILETKVLPPLRARITLSKWKISLFSTSEFQARVDLEFQAVLESLPHMGVFDISRPGRFLVPVAVAINQSLGEACPHLAALVYLRNEKKICSGAVRREDIAALAKDLLDTTVPLVVLNNRPEALLQSRKQWYMVSSQEEIDKAVLLHA